MFIVTSAIKHRIVSCLLHMLVLKLYSWIVVEELLPVKYVKIHIYKTSLYISEQAADYFSDFYLLK